MWFGALLALTWLILLLRYPAKALPVSLVAMTGLLLVGALVLWQDHRDQQRVAQLALTLQWDANCPHETPLRANLHNRSEHTLLALTWQISAELPGQGIELVSERLARGNFRVDQGLAPNEQWQHCLPLPRLRDGVNPAALSYTGIRLQAHFAP